jgi:hypothetical protein
MSSNRDEYDGLFSSFAATCRAADEKQRKKRRDPHIERLRQLLEANVSLERVWSEVSRPPPGRAAYRTVEALMFALRDGIDALKHPDNQRCLGELNDKQMQEVAARVQKFMPHIAPAWKPVDVQALLALWSKLRCR